MLHVKCKYKKNIPVLQWLNIYIQMLTKLYKSNKFILYPRKKHYGNESVSNDNISLKLPYLYKADLYFGIFNFEIFLILFFLIRKIPVLDIFGITFYCPFYFIK